MKKIIRLVALLLLMSFVLSACASPSDPKDPNPDNSTAETSPDDTTLPDSPSSPDSTSPDDPDEPTDTTDTDPSEPDNPYSYIVKLYTNGGTLTGPTNKGTYFEAKFIGTKSLPTPKRTGYVFGGWYKTSSLTGNAVRTVSQACSLYAHWEKEGTQTVLKNVSDTATSGTVDTLPSSGTGVTYTWSSSNPSLYKISGGKGKVVKENQTHRTQKVTVTVKATYTTGRIETKSKQISVAPIKFATMTKSPVATYFQSGALSAYKQGNRYQTEGTVFSSKAKETLDIVYWAFAKIDTDASGNIWHDLENPAYAQALEEMRALRGSDVRIVLCVAGLNYDESTAFKTVCSNDTLRAKFIDNIMNTVEKYNFDGVDIDWESVAGAYVVESCSTALMRDLRAEMNSRQASGGTPYLLSAAIPSTSYGAGSDRFNFTELNKYLDYVNLMSYDMHSSGTTSHLSNLYPSEAVSSNKFGCVYGVELLSSKGFSKSKIIIGSASYGKAYQVTGSLNSGSPLGVSGTLIKVDGVSGSYASGTLFGNAIDTLIASGKYTEYNEYNSSGQLVGSYLYNATDNIFVTYDSPEAIKAKYAYAKANGLGMMCWCYTEDVSDSVINALYQVK